MRQYYHVCISSHEEVLFRDKEDYIRAFNNLAIAALETGSSLLADAEMSDHIHTVSASAAIGEMIFKYRTAQTRYFNARYHRTGRLGEKEYFLTELKGARRICAATTYTIRNGLHHGVATTPFEYEFCSANCIFAKDLGKGTDAMLMLPKKEMYRFLPSHQKLPDGYTMDQNGLILRKNVIDCHFVEQLYVTPRNFLFQMNRYSGEEWAAEQMKEDNGTAPVTLETFEDKQCDLSKMLSNEKGRINIDRLRDLELCAIIDSRLVPRCGYATVYEVPLSIRRDWGNALFMQYGRRTSIKQLKRCLII